MKRALALIGAIAVAFFGVTAWALESGDVAVIETRTRDGSIRSTHVWYAESDGDLWLEAGTPENAWFLDVQRDPVVTFIVDGTLISYIARPVDHLSGHTWIRSLLREKYGLRDRWVGLITDTSGSVAVRLVPAEAPPLDGRGPRPPKDLDGSGA